jgi:hypothetical protein
MLIFAENTKAIEPYRNKEGVLSIKTKMNLRI